MRINFHFNETVARLPNRVKLKTFLNTMFEHAQLNLQEVHFIFCTDVYLLKVNRDFLQHNDYTDIITFSLAEPGEPIIGEVYISIDRVKENAKILNIPFQTELHRIIFHGVLHLCGYKDKNPYDKRYMTEAEDRTLSNYFASVPRETYRKM